MLAAIVPFKGLRTAKSRLSPALPDRARMEIALAMLLDVVEACLSSTAISRTVVVTPDPEAAELLSGMGVEVLADRGVGQTAAVELALRRLGEAGDPPSAVALLVADIPLVSGRNLDEAASLAGSEGMVVLTPSSDGGTNILVQRPPGVLRLSYGPGSFRRHLEEALRRGLRVRVYRAAEAEIDVDTPEDLELIAAFSRGHLREALDRLGITLRGKLTRAGGRP